MAAVAAGLTLLALALVLVAGGDAVAARHSFRLASRNRVGAESEARVRHTLSALAGDGWNVRHGVNWQRQGDLDHALLAPTGVGFVIETKTLRYTREHVLRTVNASRCCRAGDAGTGAASCRCSAWRAPEAWSTSMTAS